MRNFSILILILVGQLNAFTQVLVSNNPSNSGFTISSKKISSKILVEHADHDLVKKAAHLLSEDINKVTGRWNYIINELPSSDPQLIIIGSLDKSPAIKKLAESKKINASNLKGKWESYIIQVVEKPFPGISAALVIAGSDRRGTAYGVLEISKQIGVSPWYWWADVPIRKMNEIYIRKRSFLTDAPRVKYRGIFINDEAPALANWSREKFGGFNHQFYEKVFELMLRLRSNFLWPAMWGNAFYDDDSLNIKSAEEYGIVIGTSHHEPLMRAHDEWRRYGKNQKWNYDSTKEGLRDFWHKGVERAKNEKIISIGMRGDGDEPMSRETATALLERIVADQRKIISDVTGKPADQTPQLWALYKEVQDYYDKGMRVPDDVTLLLCDDNWGNIRRLPKPTDKPRKGGYGIYYHFDYVGGPRNYKWINTNSLPRIWEQMHLAWEYNAREIWIVNVGDIKPMELPISFFLDYAWNPDRIKQNDIQNYTRQWASQQFGKEHSLAIADIISKYSKYNSRRKPELLDDRTFSMNYDELNRVTNEYSNLLKKALDLNNELPANYRDAYFQLVLHPVKASSNLYDLYTTIAHNKIAYSKKEQRTNMLADRAMEYYTNDSLITLEYHRLNNGKWNHMMSQTHIGYTYWQQPPAQKMPQVFYLPEDSILPSAIKIIPAPKTAKHLIPANTSGNKFYEQDGYVSIDASNFTTAANTRGITWTVLPDHGRTGSAITTFPVTAPTGKLNTNSPTLLYEFYTYSTGEVKLLTYFSPTLNFHNSPTGLQFAVAIDDEQPQIISLNKEDSDVRTWEQWVANNIIVKNTGHQISKPGKHTIKFWAIDPGVVLQKLVIDCGGLKASYLGPEETRY